MGVRWVPFPFEARECEKRCKMPNVKVGLEETDGIRQMDKEHPAARIVRYRSFCPEVAKSRSDRSPSAGRRCFAGVAVVRS